MSFFEKLFTKIRRLILDPNNDRKPPEKHEVSGYYRHQNGDKIWVEPHTRGDEDGLD